MGSKKPSNAHARKHVHNRDNNAKRKGIQKNDHAQSGLPHHSGSRPTNRPRKQAKNSQATPTIPSACPVSHQCGACQFIDVDYRKQLEDKQQAIIELFEDLAGEDCALHPILGMSEPYRYRNKVVSPFAPGKKIKTLAGGRKDKRGSRQGKPRAQREILCGMYAKGTHRIIDTTSCLLENESAQSIIKAIRQIMPRFDIEPYNEDTGAGLLRHAIVRIGHSSNEILVTLVTNGREFPASKAFCHELKKRVPEITTIVQNVNTRMTNVILGDEGEQVLYGPGFILDDLCGLRFRISAHSFYQVNAVQTETLYLRAIEFAHLTGNETVMDAYCGTGTIGLVAANAKAAKVIGVDKVTNAIKDARNNARHNHIENAEFFAEDASEFMRKMAQTKQPLDVLFMDPPRAGSTPEFLEATCKLMPRCVVYISCNPATQARDVEFLTQRGYALTDIQPVDMFPHTEHIENICRLELVDAGQSTFSR